ncbi:hypothetical protein [Paenibacillus sp. N3.4]|uniref:hypothetical protein n=1 Tax=Paenibacillus sp. N3.4 TaxID=2603222 RepID=UPI0011C902DC|nr:hypothetical protein [Paenibacillus sp. N3.4]TXK84162.1 hypothetical protein FU659_09915 [Paenibacillus sp. N3.4]
MKLYFRDNFFNAGRTDILNESNERIGEVDLRSSFGSALDVLDKKGSPLYSGKFPMLSNKWNVTGPTGEECGLLRYRLSFMSKRYEYEAYGRGVYEITSPAFSREYEIRDERGQLSASFERVNGWFSASAYCLVNHSSDVDSYEWISVILGMHAIQKRHEQQPH